MAAKTYEREVLLHTNALPETHSVTLKVQTAPIPIATKKLPHASLALLIALASAAAWIEVVAWAGVVADVGTIGVLMAAVVTWFVAVFGVTAGIASGAGAGFVRQLLSRFKVKFKAVDTAVAIVVAGIIAMFVTQYGAEFRAMNTAAAGFGYVDLVIFLAGFQSESLVVSCLKRGFSSTLAIGFSFLAMALGLSLGIGLQIGFLHPFVMGAVLAAGLPLGTLIFYPPLERARLIANYRKFEEHLIKT